MVARIPRNNRSVLLVILWDDSATRESSLADASKTKPALTTHSRDHTPWFWLKGDEDLVPHRNVRSNVYGNFTHNCQLLEANRMSFSRRKNEETVVYPDNEISSIPKKKWAIYCRRHGGNLKPIAKGKRTIWKVSDSVSTVWHFKHQRHKLSNYLELPGTQKSEESSEQPRLPHAKRNLRCPAMCKRLNRWWSIRWSVWQRGITTSQGEGTTMGTGNKPSISPRIMLWVDLAKLQVYI